MKVLYFVVVLIGFYACKNQGSRGGLVPDIIEVKKTENQGRSTWQKPGAVIDKLGDISKSTVADIGAGTGFFSFRLAMKARQVIATDIDRDMIDLIEIQKNNLPTEMQLKISTRLTQANEPGLKNGEADKAVIINTIAYIDPLVPYLKKLNAVMADSATIMVVDYKPGYLSIPAPADNDRINISKVTTALEQSGFTIVEIDEATLVYQYIIIAKR